MHRRARQAAYDGRGHRASAGCRLLALTLTLTLTLTRTRTLTLTLTKAALHTCRTPHAAHLCPADDGGYVLLGVPRELFTSPARDAARASLFQAVRWSSSDTCTSQARALARAGLRAVMVGPTDHPHPHHGPTPSPAPIRVRARARAPTSTRARPTTTATRSRTSSAWRGGCERRARRRGAPTWAHGWTAFARFSSRKKAPRRVCVSDCSCMQ